MKSSLFRNCMITLITAVCLLFIPLCSIRAKAVADTTWQNEYNYTLDADKIVLTNYHGQSSNITIPANAIINGVTYRTFLDNDPYLYGFFQNKEELISVSAENGVSALNLRNLFSDCTNLEAVDLSGVNTAEVTDMEAMFYNCKSLTALNISGFDTSNVTNMNNMFYGCKSFTSLDLSSFDTSNVTDMGNMFHGCWALTEADLSGFDTSKVTRMNDMFRGCVNWTSLNVSNFDTGNVQTMSYMFSSVKITHLNLCNFDTSNVTDMSHMFDYCDKLIELDVSSFDTGNVTDMSYMFYNCEPLTALDVSGWDTKNVTSMCMMFDRDINLSELDVSGWDTSNVVDVAQMFPSDSRSKLTKLDLSSFDLSNLNPAAHTGAGGGFLSFVPSTLESINTPRNLQIPFSLNNHFIDSEGNEYSTFPLNRSDSILLTWNPTHEQQINRFVTRLYEVFMDRTPDSVEQWYWGEQIRKGEKTAGEVAAGFIFSPEFIDRNMCNSHFLDYLYKGLFNRVADEDGKNGWIFLMDEGYSREMVAQGFLTSPEFFNLCESYEVNPGTGLANVPALGTIQTDHCTIAGCPNDSPVKIMVVSLYDTVFGRVPDQEEVDFWVAHMSNHTPGVSARVMVNTFLNGEEYSNLNRDNGDYIRDLYHAIFNRDADADGFNDWLNRLENLGWTREQVLNGFTGSPEFVDQCHHAGIEIGAEL